MSFLKTDLLLLYSSVDAPVRLCNTEALIIKYLFIATEIASSNKTGFCISRFSEDFIKICEIGGSPYPWSQHISPASLLSK